MDASPVDCWTVLELRTFLKDRGVPFSNYNKHELTRMVKKCIAGPHLVDVREVDDDESVHDQRRCVEINGEEEIFPNPLSLSGWEKNLGAMPPVSLDKAMLYLIFKMNWPQARVTNWKKERGYDLFQSDHVHEVCMKQTNHSFVFIKGKCTRQTAQQERPYVVWILTTEEGNIACAGCQCIG